MGGNIVSLVGVVGGHKRIEKASKVAVENKTNIAYSDLVVEAARIWDPQSVTVMEACELLPIDITVSHGERRKEREGRALPRNPEYKEGHRRRTARRYLNNLYM
jgi:chloramphenicol 3-O-phosphotransferase